MGCRFPGGIDSPAAYWQALLDGINAIREVPDDRWKHSLFHDTDPEKSGSIRNAKGGFIEGVDQFDGEFFGYFPTESQRIDPQQRLLLEVTHEAMEDAGLRRDQLDGSRTSVFVGSFMYDFLCMQAASESRDEINPYVAMGTSISSLANRISYDFNLKGLSVSLDTACSSSLVAVHLACQTLWSGQADLAIAGGVNVMLRPESSIILSKAGFLNPDQYCKAFDAAANGYVRGEGAGVVILKPLSKAIEDGDSIYACVLGSGANQDGYVPEGFTVPNVLAQIALLKSVYGEAAIDPLTVDFVEAHGTGTAVGDPIETAALGSVLGRKRADDERCLLGSVKTNLGHLEGAAGIAGFIKGALVARHGMAPPNLHLHNPNPDIDWEREKLQVPTRPTPLRRNGHPWTVAVNSFGAGGTNAHVVLQAVAEANQDADAKEPSDLIATPTLYMLSAAHRDALRELAIQHADFLAASQEPFGDVAYSAFARRSHYAHLVAVVGRDSKEIEQKLRNFADGKVDPATLATKIARKKAPRLAFVFSGQGGQWAGMGQQLMRSEPVFRQTIEGIDVLFRKLAGWSLIAELIKDEATTKINDTVIVQPAVMAVQIALVKLYEHYGLRPEGIVGHSIGEVAAAFAAGALTLEQAVEVIYHRSQAQNLASGKGGMLAVGLTVEDARIAVKPYAGKVSIAAVNGPAMLTLSGDPEPLQLIAQSLESRGVFNRPVRVQVAYHSHHMDPIKDFMLAPLREVRGVEASLPLYSTVTGRRESGAHLDADYWFQNARNAVLFTDALHQMVQDGFDTFLEIGPHPVLVGGAEALFKTLAADAIIGPAMTRREPEAAVFLQSFARLAARGIEPDAAKLFGPERNYVRLPQYPWQHTRHWFESPAATQLRRGRFDHPFLKRQTQMVSEPGLAVWDAIADLQKFPYLRNHQVDGEIVFPGTGHLELAWAVANEQYRHEAFFLENLLFELPLILPENSRHPLEVRLEIVSAEGDYRICSRAADAAAETPWIKHSSGRINTVHDRFPQSTSSLAALQELTTDEPAESAAEFYEKVRKAGLDYGPDFRCVEKLWRKGSDWLALLQLPDELAKECQRYAIHPALFDACLHAIFADVHCRTDSDRIYLPHVIDRVRIHRKPTQQVWAHVHITRNDEQFLCSDTFIFNDNGDLVAEVFGLKCKRLVGAGSRQADTTYEGCFEYQWTPAGRDAVLHGRVSDTKRAVLIGDPSGMAGDLATRLKQDDIEARILSLEDFSRLEAVLEKVPLDRRTLILFVAAAAEGEPRWKGLAESPFVPAFLQVAQLLQKREGVPRFYLITNGAGGVPGDEQLDLGQAVLHGMTRVINNECANIPMTVVDLGSSITPGETDSLYHELLHIRRDRDESEVALRGNQRYVRVLVPVDRDSAEQAAASEEPGVAGAYQADLQDAGMLDQIGFRRLAQLELGADDVEIAVEAAALNFKDVMNAMGLLPQHAVAGGLTSHRLGLEVAGRVVRVGPKVRHVRIGDDVIARVAQGFCGRAVTPGHCVVRRPKQLTPQQGASIPVVYITAWYSLCHLARMEPGETVLLHSAAGGVGGAAIQLAKRAGVKIIATAGTKEKREYLRQLGVEHVFDSRSLDFHNQVMEVTEGRGVDIVLNFLTGRFIPQSLKCLAPFGRFIELGKSDIYRNNKLSMERLGENISFFVVDVDRLAAQKPALHQQMLNEIVTLFETGELQPNEITEFPISQLGDAMKFMTRAAYRGKIVVNMQNDRVRTLPARVALFRADRTYLISGGASGFGLEIARWMTTRGARHFVLLSRSGCKTDEDRATVEAMIAQGAIVELAQADVGDANAVRKLIERIQAEMPPLAGVIHGAAVMDDASLPAMNMARFERVFRPKAQGAWNLHEETVRAGASLDFFVMLSSISSALGFYGQVNYAAANFFEDALAHLRRQRGLAASAINLGVMGQYAGLSRTVNEGQDIIGLLDSQGLMAMSLADALAKMEAVLIQQPVARVTGRFDWSRFRHAYPHLVRDARFMDVLSDAALARGSRPKSSNLRTTLTELPPAERRARLEQELTAKLARILDAQPEKLDVAASIDVLGLDSLMLTDLQIWIARLLDVTLPLIKLLKGPSIATLASDLLAQLDSAGAADTIGRKEKSDSSSEFALGELDGVRILNPWLIRGRGDAEAPMRLICFHSMGVGASLFTNFLLHPPAGFDILAVQTPGRENRAAEPVAEKVEHLADQIVSQLLPFFDRPIVVWGHSYGGIMAWEVIHGLRDYGCQPVHFVVTGTIAPHLIERWQNREVILKSMVVDNSAEYLISLSRYVDDLALIKAILPGMRRDYPLLRGYRYRAIEPLSCPITAFAARQDDVVYVDEIEEWSQHTNSGFEMIHVDGDHWFVNRNRALITATLQGIASRQPRRQHGQVAFPTADAAGT
ncbi:MAG: SDR family NAD(P)-dependent oxidoreductase [Gemmataceae bacterium]|nr:SDR family NAD(P)-dependent oxidoreductase [Gemmataceae bacterium]